MEGFQLWLNLPAKDKMQVPWYRDFPAEAIPEFMFPGGIRVRVLAGVSHGVEGAVQREVTEPLYLDIHLPAGGEFSQPVPAMHNAFLYVYRGELAVAGEVVPEHRMAILANDGGTVNMHANQPSRVLLIAGRPLNEPIAQHGPFVMNTDEELQQAIADYQTGRLAQ